MRFHRMGVLSFVAGIGFYFTHRALDAEHEDLVRLQEGKVDPRSKHQDKTDLEQKSGGETEEEEENRTLMNNVTPPLSPQKN